MFHNAPTFSSLVSLAAGVCVCLWRQVCVCVCVCVCVSGGGGVLWAFLVAHSSHLQAGETGLLYLARRQGVRLPAPLKPAL